MTGETESRKLDHIMICTEKDVQSQKSTLFECVDFLDGPKFLSEPDLDCSTTFFKKKLNYPIIIAGMTGGVADAEQINKNLAQAAEELGLGFGLGSQRAMLENPTLKKTYEVRDIAPNVLLLGNIGAAQLSEYSQEQIENLALTVGANVLAVHLNSIQEKIQPEGNLPDIDYSEKVKQLCSSVKLPVILKETGMGISSKDAHSFRESGIAGIDVGGAGGTSFARVELERGGNGEFHNLENSGIPTAASILEVRKVFPNIPIIATGGIRTGFDVAKSIALGADVAGIALPLLKPAQESTEAVVGKLEKIIEDLKKAMISSNSPTVSDLKADKININGELLEWVENLKN